MRQKPNFRYVPQVPGITLNLRLSFVKSKCLWHFGCDGKRQQEPLNIGEKRKNTHTFSFMLQSCVMVLHFIISEFL